jgi:hypothetical protein
MISSRFVTSIIGLDWTIGGFRMNTIRIAVLIAAITLGSCAGKQPKLTGAEPTGEPIEPAREPEMVAMKDEMMLVVEAKGDPNVVGAKAFGLVFQLYYQIPETPKGPLQAAPRARWPLALDTPKTEWAGLYAMPIPEGVTELPPHQADPTMKASLAHWEYGEVAQIVHIGPYDKEEPTIERLKEFISAQGYATAGPHEEEYLKGPTMFSAGNPEEYVTIIRYRVKKQ